MSTNLLDPVRFDTSKTSVSPRFAQLNPPLIVVGMHRSGTSMVVGMLHRLGIYMDPEMQPESSEDTTPAEQERTDGYGEAVAFRLANEALLAKAGSDWAHVDAFLARRDEPKYASSCIKYLAGASESSLQNDYLNRFPGGQPSIWGWKDPRTSLTLPYWLHLFPKSKVLHVRRDTDAVVRSLNRRAAQIAASGPPPSTMERLRSVAANPATIASRVGRRLGLIPPVEPDSTNHWHKLTETYVTQCEKDGRDAADYLEVEYDTILSNPQLYARLLSDFAQTGASAERVDAAASFVDTNRRVKAT